MVLGVLAVAVSAWRPVPAGVWHDDGVYMLVGKAIAGGHGLTYDGVVGSPPAAKFPPLYPALLAVLWLLPGAIGSVTLLATLLNLAFLGAAAGLLAKALRSSAGVPVTMCAAAAGLALVSTDVIRAALVPLSESLFVLVTVGALALWAPATRDEGGRARLGIALLLAAAVATRSAGLALVLAFAVALTLRRGARAAALVTGPALAVTAWWSWWSSVKATQIPEGARDLLGPYGSWLAGQTVGAPAAFLAGLPSHAEGVFGRAAALLLPGLSGWVLVAAAVPLCAVSVVGLVRSFRTFPPLAWLVPIYLAMLLAWPYLDRRLLVPLHPAIVATLAIGTHALLERLGDRRARGVLLAVMAAWVALYAVVTAARIADDWPVAPYRLRAERLAAAVEALKRTAPADAVVGAPELWAALHLHGGWRVAPSARFDPRSVDPEEPIWGTPEQQIALWREEGIDHLLLEQAGTLHGAALDRLEAQCPGTVFVLAQSPPLIVVRLVWDAC